MVSTILKKLTDFSTNQEVIHQLVELTRPSYQDNTAILEREINHCNEIYLLYDDSANLIAFFMVNFEKLDNVDSYYLGLSGCRNNLKGMGYAKHLYNTFFRDCKQKEKELKVKILCWWTTATPIPYKWFNNNIDGCEPNLNGDLSESGFRLISKIGKLKYNQIDINPEIPFILPRVAEKTTYSEKERLKLEKVKEELKITAFDKYPIDETKGDRYLMIGYAPDIEL